MRAWWLVLLLAACGGGTGEAPTPPAALRTDLYYGYYLTAPGQVAETKGSVNLLWVGGPWGDEVAIANMQESQLATVLDISEHVYQRGESGKFLASPSREVALRQTLQLFQSKGLLSFLVAVYPMDEPDLNVASEEEVLKVNATVRKVVQEFPELGGVKLAVIYGQGPRWAVGTYDWVGFDHYATGSSIFTNGEYASLKGALRQDQRTLVVPGGTKGQDPTPFLDFAESNAEVVAIIPFLWADTSEFKGIRSLAVRKSYCQTGHKVLRTISNC